MKTPNLHRGPASCYAGPGERILELGNGTGNGGLLSLRNHPDGGGTIIAELYNLSGVELRGGPAIADAAKITADSLRACRAELEAAKLRTLELEKAIEYLWPRAHRHLCDGAELARIRALLPESGR